MQCIASLLSLAKIYNDRGLVYLMLNNAQSAIGDLTQAIRFNPSESRALYNRGCAYQQQGNFVAAIEDFTQVLEQQPHQAEAYFSRGLSYYELGQHKEALEDWQQAARRFYDQGLLLAYQKTLLLIEGIRPSTSAVG